MNAPVIQEEDWGDLEVENEDELEAHISNETDNKEVVLNEIIEIVEAIKSKGKVPEFKEEEKLKTFVYEEYKKSVLTKIIKDYDEIVIDDEEESQIFQLSKNLKKIQ